jgi:IS4 transposase
LAKECDPPAGVTPIIWLLLTTLPVEDFAAARRLVFWYTLRWRIERFHFTLKTGGCQVEHLQLQTFAR